MAHPDDTPRTHGHGHRPGHGHGHTHGHAHGHTHGYAPADHDDHRHDDEHRHPHDDHHGHHHVHDLRALGRQALLVALGLNGVFFVVEAAVGAWTGSLALLSDAAHMLSDVIGLVVAVVAATIRLRPRDPVATFGHGRVAVVGGFVNGALSLVAAGVIVVEAVQRLRAPPPVPGVPVLVTAALGLVVNLVAAWWLHRSGDKGVNMRGALLHMLGDALGSAAAIIAGVTLALGGPLVVDAVVSLLVAGIVGGSAVPLVRDAIHILLERAPRRLEPQALRTLLLGQPAVRDVVGLHAWDLDDGETLASFVLVTAETDLTRLAAVADELRRALADQGVVHATFEWRPVEGARGCCPEPTPLAHP